MRRRGQGAARKRYGLPRQVLSRWSKACRAGEDDRAELKSWEPAGVGRKSWISILPDVAGADADGPDEAVASQCTGA
jgi:hypothetical protein